MRIFILYSFAFIVSACGNFLKEKNPNNNQNVSQSLPVETLNFDKVRAQIFVPYCISCHLQYGDYKFVKKDLTGIQASINQNRMPKNAPPLSSELKQVLNSWIQAGAPEQDIAQVNPNPSPSPQPPTDTLVATWDSIFENIMVPKCVVCHNPNGQAKWVDVSSRKGMSKTLLKHINFKKPEDSYLIARLQDVEEPMPPLSSNLSMLNAQEVQVIIEWIENGLP